ncbi:hypothetical protein [Clostridium sp. DL1XJH146]
MGTDFAYFQGVYYWWGKSCDTRGLNDYGVVKYFGVPTFSTAIFQTWFAMGDIDSAIKLSALLMLLVFGFLALEKLMRGRKKYSYTTAKVKPITRVKLKGTKGVLVSIYAFIIFS